MSDTVVRHLICPMPMGCRWCGVQLRGHGQRWVPSKRWHAWESPTAAQRNVRYKIRQRSGADWEYDPIGTSRMSYPSTCDMSMPHDIRFSAPAGCPPFCPTRMNRS